DGDDHAFVLAPEKPGAPPLRRPSSRNGVELCSSDMLLSDREQSLSSIVLAGLGGVKLRTGATLRFVERLNFEWLSAAHSPRPYYHERRRSAMDPIYGRAIAW